MKESVLCGIQSDLGRVCLDLLKIPSELERHLCVVLINDRCSGVLTNVKTLVERESEGHGFLNSTFSQRFAVNRKNSLAAFADTSSVVLEVECDRVFSGRELFSRSNARLAFGLVRYLAPS